MHIRVKSDTYFKLKPKLSDELSDAEKTFVANGTELDIEYYVDRGAHHWEVELLNPSVGDGQTKTWYVYEPDIELGSPIKLQVISDTLFKTAPQLSSELEDSQKVFVGNGTQYDVAAFLPAAGSHVKVTLANAHLGPEKRNTWYVYEPDVEIKGTRQELKIVSDTLLKAQPVLSGNLADEQKAFVKNGTIFELNSYGEVEKNHVKVALEGAFLGTQNLTTWYAYAPDIEIDGNEPGNHPSDTNSVSQPATPNDPGQAMRFPGFDGTYYTNHPIIWTTAYGKRGNFTWGEATHGGTRLPERQEVVYGIIRICKALEDIRHRYGGRAMTINSWYRPPAVNAAVGGASRSRHLVGDAVDFVIAGVHPYDVYAKLDDWWGSKGGLASATVFTHIDTRGYRARWSYGY